MQLNEIGLNKMKEWNEHLTCIIKVICLNKMGQGIYFIFSFQPFLLEIEFLNLKGETVFRELTSLPGVETQERESSPVPPLLLFVPPPIPTILKPLKDRLLDVNTSVHHIWITDVSFI